MNGPRPERITVVGGGAMGIGIAAAAVAAGYGVEVVEPGPGAGEVRDRVERILVDGERRGKLDAGSAGAAAGVAVVASVGETSPQPSAVIEAVPEDLELKRTVLAEAERLQPQLLASNTSAISIAELGRDLQRPEAFLGMHFFNPVAAMALVEVVFAEATSPQALAKAGEIVARLGKESIEVRDVPGFASSRLGVLLGVEAARMVEEEVASPAAIDRAMELGYRHPMGPLRLSDLVGIDVRCAIAERLSQTYGERFAPPPLMRTMVAEGRLGRKSGGGFFPWDDPPGSGR